MRPVRAVPLALALLAALALPAAGQAAPAISELPAAGVPWGVAPGSDGNVWVTDSSKPGSVMRFTPGGASSTLADVPGDAKPIDIAAGPGGVWFTQTTKNRIVRMAADGAVTEFAGGSHDSPSGITAGPDGNVWYTATGKGGAIGRIRPATGAVTEFTAGLTADSSPQSITAGPDGNLWFTEAASNRIGRITPQGQITEFAGAALLGAPQDIAAGPDGNLWYTDRGLLPAIVRVTPAGAMTVFRTGLLSGSLPQSITAGGDGNVYFTDDGANAVGRVTPAGAITTFAAGITAGAGLQGIATGPDGRLWFAESATAKVGRMSVAPGAGAAAAAGVTDVTATVSGAVTPNSEATTYHFEYGQTASYGQETAELPAGAGATPQTVTATLGSLSASTTYHVRLVATNATGTTYGPDHAFTTTAPGAPSATSEPATAVSAGEATLNATVNPRNGVTEYRFEWGTDETYGSRMPAADAAVGSDASDHAVSEILTGLEPNTTYHFRVVAVSPSGTTYGAGRTFTTAAVAPAAATAGATAVTAAGATLTATVDPNNSATAYRFEWGLSNAYGNSAPEVDGLVAGDHSAHAVSEAVTGLEPNTTYHFRVVATSNAGVTYGADQTFTTAATAPLATTAGATAITATAASLRATIDPRRSAATYRFEWGPTAEYGQATPATDVAANLAAHEVATEIAGLTPGTTYHFRVVAESAGGTARGEDRTFTTEPAPAPAPATTGQAPPGPGAAAPAPQTAPAPRPRPRAGRTAVASVTRGTIRILRPGSRTPVVLSGDVAIPTGSVVDARNGTLVLENALDSRGRTQRASFRGARFSFSLSKRDRGMVEVRLREPAPSCPSRSGATVRAAKKGPGRVRSLWIKDRKGKYRTHGRNSVAIVRGTEWTTTETCRGTVTRVIEGAVLVKDRRTGRSVLLRRGDSYVARRAR